MLLHVFPGSPLVPGALPTKHLKGKIFPNLFEISQEIPIHCHIRSSEDTGLTLWEKAGQLVHNAMFVSSETICPMVCFTLTFARSNKFCPPNICAVFSFHPQYISPSNISQSAPNISYTQQYLVGSQLHSLPNIPSTQQNHNPPNNIWWFTIYPRYFFEAIFGGFTIRPIFLLPSTITIHLTIFGG